MSAFSLYAQVMEEFDMHKNLPGKLATLLVLGHMPIAAYAVCENYELSQTPEQIAYLLNLGLENVVPEGDAPTIRRCDTNSDNSVDINDIRAIASMRNNPAAHPDDPMDWDRNNVINILDARGCQRACSLPRCAVPSEPQENPTGGSVEEASCFQSEDLDGDGNQEFVGMYQYTGEEERAGDWNLEVVILLDDESGNVQHVTYPFSGQSMAGSAGNVELHQHLSRQPAGLVNLNPGSVTIDSPGVVSYRFGRPKVLYYWKDGQINRALFGIDD